MGCKESVGPVCEMEWNARVGAPISHRSKLYSSSSFGHNRPSYFILFFFIVSSISPSSIIVRRRPTCRPNHRSTPQDNCQRIKSSSAFIAMCSIPPFLQLLSLFSDFRQRQSTLPQWHDYIIESLSSVFIVTDSSYLQFLTFDIHLEQH